MKPKTSLIVTVVTVAAAVALAGPALSANVPAGADERAAVPSSSQTPTYGIAPDVFERAVLAREAYLGSRSEQVGRPVWQVSDGVESMTSSGLNASRNTLQQSGRPVGLVSDSVDAARASISEPVTATSSGTGIEWPQLGIGFGLGILVALGLGLTMRFAHIRPLAH